MSQDFFCGDDVAGKRVVKQLVEDVGFEAVDAEPLMNARLLEPLMLLWVACAQSLGTRDIAFRLLRRSAQARGQSWRYFGFCVGRS